MNGFAASTLAALVAAGGMMIVSPAADAHGGRHARVRVGVHIGAPVVVSPWWYHPRPYYYGYGPHPYWSYGQPRVVVREEPTVFIEQNPPLAQAPAPQAAPQPQQHWFFCQDTQTYYPHVQTCATPWQRVIPHAPPQ
ncbi:MAG: hypothetical protein FJY56_02950 [Betaproteobacteria bacterium]|nr:hypothetical protein [Betaproteobacteria bacterium]